MERLKKHGVLFVTISILLMLTSCSSHLGNLSGTGTASGQVGTSSEANNGTAGTSANGNGEAAQEQTKGRDEGVYGIDQSPVTGSQTSQNTQTGQAGENIPNSDIEAEVAKTLNSMSTAEKIGQMFVLGFDGTEPGPDIKEMIKSRYIGGVILFERNVNTPGQLLKLNNSLKQLNSGNKAPLLICVDEEGGRVSRMPDKLVDMPAALTVGDTGNYDYAYSLGGMLAEEIGAFGFNTDFAPVLDIWSNPQNTVIGDRSFGTTPEVVSRIGIAAMKGIADKGIISVVKHFPGHGDTETDSHIGLPYVTYDMNRLESFELEPFKAAINNGADAVMVAHIVVNALDKKYPASLSKPVITDLLRKSMGFDGVVITDDMTMGAITKNYSIENAAVKAVLAGSDIVLVCHGADKQSIAMDAIMAAVRDGTIPVVRINESAGRILKLKYKYGLSDNTIRSVNVDGLNKKIAALLHE